MNNTLTNTSGIDCDIQEMQIEIYDQLLAQDSISKVEGFGRVYKNQKVNGGVIPEYYIGNNNYRELYLDSSWSVSFSFIVGDNHTTQDGIVYVVPVKIVFWFNLNNIDTDKRADAEAHRIVSEVIKYNLTNEYQETGIETGINNVYSGFDVDSIQFDDMQPFHVFSYNMNLTYYLTKKC